MQGIIIKNISDLYTVKWNDKKIDCKAKGKFRKDNIIPTVGDNVIFDIDKKIITEILERKNVLVRPPISNIDIAIIVMSVKEPIFNTNLLDKLLNIIEFNNIKPVICLSKLDLLEDKNEINKYIDYYQNIGYEIVLNTDYEKLKKIIHNKIIVITGQSGVGKSTMLNNLDNTLTLKTNEISHALGRGKHTTRHVELLEMYGGLIADTPGFSSLTLKNMTKEDIRDNMIEFNDYKDKCKYKDCMHLKEEDCYIKKLIDNGDILKTRYENYEKFINEIKNQKNY